MYKKTISYIDYDGNPREEDFYFNLTQAEVAEMELSTTGGLSNLIARITKTQDKPELIRLFKKIILMSYGEKSPDGRRFIKHDGDHDLCDDFAQTEAYSKLFMELVTDEQKSVEFINNVIPAPADTPTVPDHVANPRS